MNKIMVQVAAIVLIMPRIGAALEFGAQPRFNTGVQYYEYSQDSFSTPSDNPDFSNTASDLEYHDVLPFVSGGLSLFAERLYVDFSVQYSFDGEDEDRFTDSNFIGSDTVVSSSSMLDNEFDRLEYAVTLGYAVTDKFLVFAGYKWAKTEFNANLRDGQVDGVSTSDGASNPFISGTFVGKLDQDIKYDGPFVGGLIAGM